MNEPYFEYKKKILKRKPVQSLASDSQLAKLWSLNFGIKFEERNLGKTAPFEDEEKAGSSRWCIVSLITSNWFRIRCILRFRPSAIFFCSQTSRECSLERIFEAMGPVQKQKTNGIGKFVDCHNREIATSSLLPNNLPCLSFH